MPLEPFSVFRRGLPRRISGRFPTGIWVLTITSFLNTAGTTLGIPFLALYLHQEHGLSMTVVGTVLLVSGLSSAVGQLFGGTLTDRFGRRPVLLGSMAARAVIYLSLAVLIGIDAPVWAVIIAFAGGYFIFSVERPITSAMVADLSAPERLTETYGLLRVGLNLGWAVGPALGGYLLLYWSYSWLFGIAALTGVITFLMILFWLRESYRGTAVRVGIRTIFYAGRDWVLLKFTGLSLLVFLVMGQLVSTLSVFTVDRMGMTTAQFGLLLTVNGLVVVVFQYPVSRLIGGLAKYRALMLGSLLYGLGYLSMAWSGNYGVAVAAMVVITAGEIIFSPTSLAVVGEISPRDWRGRYMGFFGLSETLGMSGGSLLGGILLDAFPAQPLFVWGTIASLALVATVGFQGWGKALSRRNDRLSSPGGL